MGKVYDAIVVGSGFGGGVSACRLAEAGWRVCKGYLITQFLSSGINDRTDEYGGDLENRARFLIEIIRAIR